MASILNVDRIVDAAGTGTPMIPGHVVQVVQASATAGFSTTNTSSFAATGFSASITPSSSSNKILVMGSVPIYIQSPSGGVHAIMTVFRGGVASGTNISTSPTNFGLAQNYSAGVENISMGSFQVLDSPATTSSVTYEVGLRMAGSATAVTIAVNQDMYTMTLLEIAQ